MDGWMDGRIDGCMYVLSAWLAASSVIVCLLAGSCAHMCVFDPVHMHRHTTYRHMLQMSAYN